MSTSTIAGQGPAPLTLSAPAAAQLLGVSRATFWRWQAAGMVPKPTIKHGRCVRWAFADIEAYARGEALRRGEQLA